MGFTDSFKKVIGLSEIGDDEIVTEEELKVEKKRIEKEARVEREGFSPQYQSYSAANKNASSYGSAQRGSSFSSKTGEKRFSVAGANSLKLIIIEPTGIEECQKLVDGLKAHKPIIINLEKLETEIAKKIFDFLSGATYALDGNVQKIANNIFIFTPDNVSVSTQNAHSSDS